MVDNLSDTEIYSRLQATLQKVIESIPLEKITPDTRLQEDLEIDSIRVVDVILAIEDEFGIHIEDDLIETIKTIGDAINIVKRKTN